MSRTHNTTDKPQRNSRKAKLKRQSQKEKALYKNTRLLLSETKKDNY